MYSPLGNCAYSLFYAKKHACRLRGCCDAAAGLHTPFAKAIDRIAERLFKREYCVTVRRIEHDQQPFVAALAQIRKRILLRLGIHKPNIAAALQCGMRLPQCNLPLDLTAQ